MADTEVENILREIREKVCAEQEASAIGESTASNGAGVSSDRKGQEIDSLGHLKAYLVTTARAWDRLPPLVSNRSGTAARLELWFKRHLKRATRWYAWEQVNFNAAVHHALSDLLQLLAAHEKTIDNLHEQLHTESSERERYGSQLKALRSEVAAYRAATDPLIKEQRAQGQAIEAFDARLENVVGELRELIQHLQEEQRVSYKQIALEASEASVLEDRARRRAEVLLEEIKSRVEKLESRKP